MMINLNYESVPTPPKLSEESIDKLDKTAVLLAEICKIWQTDIWGNIPIRTYTLNPDKDSSEFQSDCFTLDWFQHHPFVVSFYNPHYEIILRAKIINELREQTDD